MKLLVKLGGTLLDTPETRDRLAAGIAAAHDAGAGVVVAHGGGKQMTRYLAERGVESRFVNGLRVTARRPSTPVLKVFAGSVNHELVAALNRAGAPAVGISGIDAFLAEAEQMDPALGAVGPRGPLEPGRARDAGGGRFRPGGGLRGGRPAGRVYNVNADQMAAACAAAFGVDRLVFLTDVEGVLDASRKALPALTAAAAEELIAGGVATGGMQAKLGAALAALRGGVPQVRIAPGAAPGHSGTPAGG